MAKNLPRLESGSFRILQVNKSTGSRSTNLGPKLPLAKIWTSVQLFLTQRKEQYDDWGYGHHGILQPAQQKRI